MIKFAKKNIRPWINVASLFLVFIFAIVILISCTDNTRIITEQPAAARIGSINISAAGNKGFKEDYKDGIDSLVFPEPQEIARGVDNPEDGTAVENREGEINQVEEIIEENIIEEEEQTGSGEIIEEDSQGNVLEIDYSNSDNFRIEVDLSRQKVLIYYRDNLLKEWICSGGTDEKPTPVGEFKTTQKGEWFFSDKYKMGAYHWIRFYEDYLFHSVPFDNEKNMIQEEYEKLGSPSSHGCIRLEVENARWLYEMLPLGVKVMIY